MFTDASQAPSTWESQLTFVLPTGVTCQDEKPPAFDPPSLQHITIINYLANILYNSFYRFFNHIVDIARNVIVA